MTAEIGGRARVIYEVRDGRITIKGQQYPVKLADGFYIIRKLTVLECKRLQTVPDSYIDYYTAKIAELQTLKVEILREISGLEYKLKAIVTDYYLHGLKWEQVSARNHYSERQCKNIRDAAVGSLVKSFGANKIIAGFSFSKLTVNN